jgi:hypothetical protein
MLRGFLLLLKVVLVRTMTSAMRLTELWLLALLGMTIRPKWVVLQGLLPLTEPDFHGF